MTTFKEMCEVASRYLKKEQGMDVAPTDLFNASPTGEGGAFRISRRGGTTGNDQPAQRTDGVVESTMNLNLLNYRITRQSVGMLYGRDYKQTYTEVYTQPWWRYLAGKAYHHVWEEFTWRGWRYLERFDYRDETDRWHIPFSNKQEIRCFDMQRKDRIVLSTVRGEKVESKLKMDESPTVTEDLPVSTPVS